MPTETKWTLPTPDGKTIYGVKNTSEKPATAAIFMMQSRISEADTCEHLLAKTQTLFQQFL